MTFYNCVFPTAFVKKVKKEKKKVDGGGKGEFEGLMQRAAFSCQSNKNITLPCVKRSAGKIFITVKPSL